MAISSGECSGIDIETMAWQPQRQVKKGICFIKINSKLGASLAQAYLDPDHRLQTESRAIWVQDCGVFRRIDQRIDSLCEFSFSTICVYY